MFLHLILNRFGSTAAGMQLHSRRLLEAETGWAHNSSTTNAIYTTVVILLVIGSGLMSGLTLGLLSLDHIEMEVLRRSGTETQKRLATRIMPVISDTHWLLVTLLLCNAGRYQRHRSHLDVKLDFSPCPAGCMEALPIFLDTLVSAGWQAIIIGITAILIFGEIVPQSICARHGLAIGAFLAPMVRGLMWLTAVISWPIARLLDLILGSEKLTLFRRKELRALVDMHGEDEGLGGKLSEDEVTIICG